MTGAEGESTKHNEAPQAEQSHRDEDRVWDRALSSSVKWLLNLNLHDDTPGKLFKISALTDKRKKS